jgi:hypothetical protein
VSGSRGQSSLPSWVLVVLGLIGIGWTIVAILLQRHLPTGVLVGAIVLLLLGLVGRPRQSAVSDYRAAQLRQANIWFVVSFALGVVLELGAAANLLGFLGTTPKGGLKNNPGAILAICFGALAFAFTYAAYRAKQRLASGRRDEDEQEGR